MALRSRDVSALRFDHSGPLTQIVWDRTGGGAAEALEGFGVQLFATGKKSFVVQYRVRGRTRRLSLGATTRRTVEQAREEARKVLVQALGGTDPAEERRRKPAVTFTAFAKLYIDQHAKPHKRSWREDQRRLDLHLLPRWGRMRLDAISPQHVAAMHAAIGKDHKHEANRLLALAGVMFTKAREWGNLLAGAPNPASGIRQFAERSRERFLNAEEVDRLLSALGAEENIFHRSAFSLYLLLAVRRSELLRLRWDDVDLARRTAVLRETKANRVHTLPLSTAALGVFADLHEHRVQDNPYVFPSPTVEGGHMNDLKKPWQRIRKRARLEDVRLHDLRRTVGSWLAQDGASLHLIGAVLNHSDADTTRIYARLGDNPAREALERHGEKVVSLAGWKRGKRSA